MTLARRQLSILPELYQADVDGVRALLARGNRRDSSINRYIAAACAWQVYCEDRGEKPWDASTSTLLGWLDWRVRNSTSPESCIRMSLAAARFLQDGYCHVHTVEAVPYTPKARVQLGVYVAAATLDRRTPTRARPLRLDDLITLVSKVRARVEVRRGVTFAQARALAERDAAMLLVGWWGALRADDIAALDNRNVEVNINGLRLELAGKTERQHVAIIALAARHDSPELCPLAAIRRMSEAGFTAPTMFGLARPSHVGRRLKTVFARNGIPRGYTSHSLRAGFATECAAQGVPDHLVQTHGRWRSAEQHAEYVRLGRLWQDTPTAFVRLPAAQVMLP